MLQGMEESYKKGDGGRQHDCSQYRERAVGPRGRSVMVVPTATLTSREELRGSLLPGPGPASLFGSWLRAWKTLFQEFDLAVMIGFVFGDMKPFGVVVGWEVAVHRR
jgi:hypothetical protein